jgi:hypothetical protein
MSYDITSRFFHWMEANNISRQAAAKALDVDERSLSTYRSRGLPRRKHARATQIMQEHSESQQPQFPGETRIGVPFTDEELALVQEAARIVGNVPIPQFIQRAATHVAKEEIAKAGERAPTLPNPRVVDYDPPTTLLNEGNA